MYYEEDIDHERYDPRMYGGHNPFVFPVFGINRNNAGREDDEMTLCPTLERVYESAKSEEGKLR